MQKKFEINRTKIKGSFQSARKVVTNESKSDLPLVRSNCAITYLPTFHKVRDIYDARVQIEDPTRAYTFWDTYLLTVIQF